MRIGAELRQRPDPGVSVRVATVVGARPQFVKLGALLPCLAEEHDVTVIHTGQHYDYEMSALFFEQLSIPSPDYNLGVGSGSHGVQTGTMMLALEPVLLEERPDLVLVFGDTNSTLAAALVARKCGFALAHVEAGVRDFDRSIPEEVNRIVTDHCSDLLFCPTHTAVDNLAHEGIRRGVHLTGDVMADALARVRAQTRDETHLRRHGLLHGEYLLATVHRARNTDDGYRLGSVMEALGRLDETVVLPLHPRTARRLTETGIDATLAPNIIRLAPAGYAEFLSLLAHARCLVTDSGGAQKEACILGVPCVTLSESTGWVETAHSGWNQLVGARSDAIVDAVKAAAVPAHRPLLYPPGACRDVTARLRDWAADEPRHGGAA